MATLLVDPADASEDVSTAVVRAVANLTGRDPLSVTPLSEVVDPDALDALFGGGTDARVTFRLDGCAVTVRADDRIEVRGPDAP